MRDQPFKKHFPIEKIKAQENYKYPTYQHYYRTKDLRNQDQANPNRMQANTEKNIKTQQQAPHTPTLLNKKTTKSSLKAQLENLKVEVQRIMERKQGILKSPIEKKLFPAMERNKSDSHFAISPSKLKEEEVDQQSVNSQTLLEEPLKKLELKADTQNYDHNKYMELENELLKTELKNLKNKYISKKQQLKEKCSALQKKVAFLENSLFNSEKALAAEIQTLKQNLKAVQKERQAQLIPTSDKAGELSPKKAEAESDVVKQKIKKLYDQLSKKNKLLHEKQQAVQNLTNQLSKVKKDCSLKEERMKTLSDEVQELKQTKNSNMMLLSDKDTRIEELLDQLEEERSKQYETNKNQSNDQIQDKIEQLKREYEEKIRSIKEEYQQNYQHSKTTIDEKVILEEELKFLENQNQEKQTKIQQLNLKIKQALSDCQCIEEKYMKMLEKTEKKHEEALNNLHLEYQSKIANLSARREKSLRDYSISEKGSKDRAVKQANEGSPAKEHEVRKWKLQYKQLKQRYEQHVKAQSSKKQEIKEYYKNYRDCKQKAQVYSHKLKLFEKEFEKYLSLLTAKENQLLKKQIELRKLTSDWNIQKNTYQQQVTSLTQKYKTLQEKYNEEAQRYETEIAYRKEVEEKVFSIEVTDDSLKQVMERMKKRLIEQDQKYSKYVKDLKNKQTLNSKLKQELREVMQNMEKKVNQQKTKEITDLIQRHVEKEFDAFKEWKRIAEGEKKIMAESHDNLTAEIESLKATIFQKEEGVASLQEELNNFAHSYNLKNIQMNQLIEEREFMIRRFNEDIKEMNIIKGTVENILHEELARKNEEITSLRMQIAAQSIRPLEYKSFHASFDDILKSHIEDNKKLRDDITKKTEEIFKLRDNYGSLRSQYQNLKAQIEINKLKSLSEMKNMEVNYQVETDKIKNELDMAEKKVNLLEQKFKLVIEENKKKDTFIQTYIVGKKLMQSDKDLVTNFIKQYQITVGSSDIAHRLANETQEIEKLTNYNRLLLKEVSQLKEKLMQFEAIDEEKVSMYDSKLSKYSINSGDINQQPQQEIESKPAKEKGSFPSENRLKKAQSMQIFTQIQHQI